jgi:hypothetical protein
MAKDLVWAAPPDVRQNYDRTCWAAAMEAFCAVSPGRPKLDQEQIFTQYERFALPDESMSRAGLRALLKDVRWGMNMMEVTPEGFTASPEFLYQKLTAGHVFLGYWEPKISGWHVGLVYGLTGRTVHYLNPDDKTGGRLKDDLKYFAKKGPLVVGWRKW